MSLNPNYIYTTTKSKSTSELFEINVPEGKQIIKTELEDGLLITFEDIINKKDSEYITFGNGRMYTRVFWKKALEEYIIKLKNNPNYGPVYHVSGTFL